MHYSNPRNGLTFSVSFLRHKATCEKESCRRDLGPGLFFGSRDTQQGTGIPDGVLYHLSCIGKLLVKDPKGFLTWIFGEDPDA